MLSKTNEAVEFMAKGDRSVGVTAGELGDALWPNRTTRRISQHGGGDYAAQMLLGRMRRAGLVTVVHGEGSSRWALTSKGVDRVLALRDLRSHERVMETTRYEVYQQEQKLLRLKRLAGESGHK